MVFWNKKSSDNDNNKGNDELKQKIVAALATVIDPDLHKDIVSLGFVKNITSSPSHIKVEIELTTPACPVKDALEQECRKKIIAATGIENVELKMGARTLASELVSEQNISLAKVKNIIAVASGKGGVGKSTTAVNLAFALQKNGAAVGILDADVYGPSVPLMTQVANPTEHKDNKVIPPTVNGVKIISTAMFSSAANATILRGPMAASIIKQFLTQIDWGELDYLIIDFPPGTGDIQLTIAQTANISGGVIVTTPQEVALIDVRKAIAMFEVLKVPVIGVVETMSYFVCDGCEKKHHIFSEGGGEKVAEEYGVPFLGGVPIDSRVVTSGDNGLPLVVQHYDTHAAKSYFEVAGNVARHLSIINSTSQNCLHSFELKWEKM